MTQIGGVYTTFGREEGIRLQKYRDRNGRCIAILFESIGVRVDGLLLSTQKRKKREEKRIDEKRRGEKERERDICIYI